MFKKGSSSSRRQSAVHVRRFFQWLESRYGGIPVDTGRSAEVLTSQHILQTTHLERLVRHEATAVMVREFYPTEAAAALGRTLAEEAATKSRNWKVSTSRGLESSDVCTLGEHPPFNVVAASSDPSAVDDYFAGVLRELQQRRRTESGQPQLWPLDLFRLQLDEAWPSGAGLAREESSSEHTKRPYSGGLPRVMKGPVRWKRGYIHVDEMGPLNPEQGLFSANIYLQLPEKENTVAQPAIHVWPVGIRSRWDWYRNAVTLSGLSSQEADAQVQLWNKLGEPVSIAVEPGDLVLLCVQRPHAAAGFTTAGTRVSLQCFVQHLGPNQRLLVDS
jgi:hypothetical protein